jgi:hypothetical protein
VSSIAVDRLLRWDSRSGAERAILETALDVERPMDALNLWVPIVAPEFGAIWERKVDFVPPLQIAAVTLLEDGIIDLFEDAAGSDLGHKLPTQEAAGVLGDLHEWWSLDAVDEDLDGDVPRADHYFVLRPEYEAAVRRGLYERFEDSPIMITSLGDPGIDVARRQFHFTRPRTPPN